MTIPDADRRLTQARALDQRIRAAAKSRNEHHAELAFTLLEMDEGKLYTSLGFESIFAYSYAVTGDGSGKTRQLLATARRLRLLPRMREAFVSGQINWTKARTAATAAELDGLDEEWTDLAKSLSSRELEAEVKSQGTGEPRLERMTFVLDVTPEQRATVEDAIVAEMKRSEDVRTRSAAVLRILERSRSHRAEGRVVHPHPVEASPGDDRGEETREGASRPVGALARSIDSMVLDSDAPSLRIGGGRCRFPTCGNQAWLERRDEGRVEVVQDRSDGVLLCRAHHGARHRGEIVVSGQDPSFVFALADGTVVQERPRRPRERKPDPEREADGRPESGASRSAVLETIRALVGLGVESGDARVKALAAAGDLSSDAPAIDLLRRALRSSASVRGAGPSGRSYSETPSRKVSSKQN